MTQPPALELRGIGKRFGSLVALDDVALVVRPGTVHALLGENGAGKSTLMRIAFGMLRADRGTVAVDGAQRTFAGPADAIAAGVGMVHQHFTLVPAMTVAENIALGGRGRYDARAAEARVAEVGALTGFALDPRALVGTLSVGAQQRVEIAKAVARHARVLVLDEPTGVLAPAEIDELLRWLRGYVERGNAAVLITHKLREALAVADDVSVLRLGRLVLGAPARGTTAASLTAAMIGDAPSSVAPAVPGPAAGARVVFRAVGVTLADGARVRVRDASFGIAAGEIVGVAGVEGSGQRELLRALAGRLAPVGGLLARPADVGFVPEDRHHDAVLLDRPLTENVALKGAGARRGLVDWAAVRARTRALMSAFDVRGGDAGMPMRALSGGNQQKLVLARELAGQGASVRESSALPFGARGAPPQLQYAAAPDDLRHHAPAPASDSPQGDDAPPEAIVLENPTRGLDVRATAAIHARLREAAARGTAVVLYSSDLDEVLALASRVLVLYAGTVRERPVERDAVGRAMLGLE